MIEQLPPYGKEEPSMQDGDLYMNRGFGVGNSAEHAIEKILCSLLPLASLFAGDEGDTRDNRPMAAGEDQTCVGDTPQAARACEKRTRRAKAAAG